MFLWKLALGRCVVRGGDAVFKAFCVCVNGQKVGAVDTILLQLEGNLSDIAGL